MNSSSAGTVWTHVVVNLLDPIGSGGHDARKQVVSLPQYAEEQVVRAAERIGLSKSEFIRRAAVSSAVYINKEMGE